MMGLVHADGCTLHTCHPKHHHISPPVPLPLWMYRMNVFAEFGSTAKSTFWPTHPASVITPLHVLPLHSPAQLGCVQIARAMSKVAYPVISSWVIDVLVMLTAGGKRPKAAGFPAEAS